MKSRWTVDEFRDYLAAKAPSIWFQFLMIFGLMAAGLLLGWGSAQLGLALGWFGADLSESVFSAVVLVCLTISLFGGLGALAIYFHLHPVAPCDHCGVDLADPRRSSIVIATRNCPECGRRQLDEPLEQKK